MKPPQQILRAFANQGHLGDVQYSEEIEQLEWSRTHLLIAFLTGTVSLLGQDALIRIGVTADFPNDLPYVQLVTPTAQWQADAVAHLERDGNLCYFPTREMTFDPGLEDGLPLLAASLAKATNTLETSLITTHNTELLDEFTSYWDHAQSAEEAQHSLDVYIQPDDDLRLVHAWRVADKNTSAIRRKHLNTVADHRITTLADEVDLPHRYRLQRSTLRLPSTDALYLPLMVSSELRPPTRERFWTPHQFRRLVRTHLPAPQLERLDELLSHRRSKRDVVVLGMPRPGGSGEGARSLVVVELSGAGGAHPLLPGTDLSRVILRPRSVTRRDPGYLLQRGGSDAGLHDKSVLILGCGSLGGHAAMLLAAAGVGHLTLVDYDRFTAQNSFRHVLGGRFVGQVKVTALAQALVEKYPYLDAVSRPGRTTQLLSNQTLDLTAFDLIFDSTGSGTHHLSLAETLRIYAKAPPVLLTWLDPMSLGGHAVTVLPGQRGCPRCLYSDPTQPLFNRVAFSAPHQHLAQTALGCGGSFTPFSDLDAVQTATLAVRRAVSILTKQETRNTVQSWKGDATAFERAGFEVSNWYKRSKHKTLRQGVEYATEFCPQCRGP